MKRPHEDAGVGRGSGRPPGVTQNSIAGALAQIQALLAQQTVRMSELADKEDVRGLREKVDSLCTVVDGHTKDISKLQSSQADDCERYEERLEQLEQKVQLLSEAGPTTFN